MTKFFIPVLLCVLIALFPISTAMTKPSATTSVEPAKPMKPETIYTQDFYSPIETIYEIDIPFVTYQKTNLSGTLRIALSSGDEVIAEKTVDVATVPDNTTYQFSFDRTTSPPDRLFTLSLSYDKYDDDTLAFYSGDTSDSKIFFNLKGRGTDYLHNIWWIITIIIASGLISITTLRKGKHEKH